MTIDGLNLLDRERFVSAVGWVFEDSPWVAGRAWDLRPFSSVDALHHTMTARVEEASREEQLALLRAHPDLGARARMGDASAAEQAGAGLDRLTREEYERLLRLNEAYRDTFGFPFLFAVKGSTKHDILRALEQRLQAEPEDEYREALRQVYRIAGFRLREVVS